MYQNINGDVLTLKISKHGSVVEEYVIENQSFKYDRWLLYTAIFSIIFLLFGLHHQHTSFLTSLCIVLSIFALSKLHLKVKKESLLIIKMVGMQITTIFTSGRKSAKFIAWERIQGIVINEAVTMHQVLFYLVILLNGGPENSAEILPVFQHTLPRLECLKTIFCGIHETVNKFKVQKRVL